MLSDKSNIEKVASPTAEPDLDKIEDEVRQAQIDNDQWYQRMEHARHVWHSRWNKPFRDGKKHATAEDDKTPFPWEGASDSRLRLVAGIVREHVTLAKYSFFNAKVQARSVRPLVEGRQSSKISKFIQWRVYNQMRRELMRELPLAWAWKYALGVSFLSVEWEQERRLEYWTVNIQDLQQISQAKPEIQMVIEALADPAMDETLVPFVQELSSIITTAQAKKIIRELREKGETDIQIAYPYINKPRWSALRPVIDLIIPSETDDIQQSRWVSRREWVSEAELKDRIETENYNADFVDEAIKHKGETMMYQWEWWRNYPYNSYRDLIEIHHFYYKAITNGTPCLYKTIFQPLYKKSDTNKKLYAYHGLFPYSHGQYPVITMRRNYEDKTILRTIGIAEEAFTDELDMKIQQDGITDRTSLILAPPMVVPYSRVKAMQNSPLPKGIIGGRRGEIDWMPLPPFDGTPVEIINMIQQRIDRRYGLFAFGKDGIDPQLLGMRKQEVANDNLLEMEQALEMTLELEEQFTTDEEVESIVGKLDEPFHRSRLGFNQKRTITATIDMKSVDENYMMEKLDGLSKIMPFKQEGKLFEVAASIFDPDMADELQADQTSPQAMEKEKADERIAISNAFDGIEPDFPMMGNHQLRLQTLMNDVFQSPNPRMRERLAQNPDTEKILQNRAKMFQNQIQQFQQNPIIGRALGTSALRAPEAPQLTGAPQ